MDLLCYYAVSIPLTVLAMGLFHIWDWNISRSSSAKDGEIVAQMLDMKRKSQKQAIRIAAV